LEGSVGGALPPVCRSRLRAVTRIEADIVDGVATEEESEAVVGEPVGDSLPAPTPEVRTLEPQRSAPPAVVQAMALAAGSALAGAVTVAIVKTAARALSGAPARRQARRRTDDVVATRTFLVDVHLLGDRR
jgi:hypothetical protein